MDHVRGFRSPASSWRACRRSWFSVPGKKWLTALAVMVAAPELALPGVAAAQQPVAALSGTVTNAHGSPLSNAQVLVAGTRHHTLTQRAGQFRLSGVPAGAQTLEVHFVGYQVVKLPLELEPGQTMLFEIRLELAPVDVAEVEANALRGLSPEMQGFYERRSRGNGHFFTREEIGRMQARAFTDVIRRVPGAAVVPVSGRFGSEQTVQMARATGITGARPCPVVYFMNGMQFPLAPEFSINQFVRPDEITGIEVYAGSSRLPPQFHNSVRNARCGVIVIWTRDGPIREPRAR